MTIESLDHPIVDRKFTVPNYIIFLFFGKGESIVVHISMKVPIYEHFIFLLLALLKN